jgi:hypothetical protein
LPLIETTTDSDLSLVRILFSLFFKFLNGKWGVGKTYFWHQFKEQLTDKKVAYISLFGKETISSIRTDITYLW